MAATNYTPIQLYYSTTASAVPLAANLAQGELAINIADGKLYYEDSAGVVQVIATKGAGTIGGSTTQIQYNNAGALAGSAAMTFNNGTNTVTLTTLNLTNALGATYGGTAQSSYTQGDILYSSATNTLSKLGIGTVNYILTSTGSVPQWVAPTSVTVQTANNLAGGAAGSVPYQSAPDTTTFLSIGAANRVMTSSGTAPQWVTALTGLTGVSSSSITNTSLTSGRVVYSTTGGAQTDDADLTFNGTTLSAGGYSTSGLSTLVKTVTIGNSNFDGSAVFAAATPAKLYIGTGTVTDTTSAIGATNAVGAISSLAITPIAATNTSVTYTNASTLYIAGAPSAGTNVTLTNPYALYVAAGDAYFGGTVTAGTVNLTTLDLTNLEVTNIKAKDGTASITLADSTGVASFTANPVLSGGTANGVLYLNGSKSATSGSALTFNGTTFGINTTIGNSTSLSITGDYTSNNVATFIGVQRTGGAVAGAWSYSDLLGSIQFGTTTNHALVFLQNNAEAMRLNNTGLAIGSTSSLYTSKLTVAYNPTSTNGPIIVDNRSFGINRGGAQWFGGQYNTAGDYRPYSGIIGAKENGTDGNSEGFLALYVNKNAADATEIGRFTSAGFFGIGTNNPSTYLSVLTGVTYAATFNTTVTSASSTRISLGGLGSSAGGTGGSAAIGNSTNHSATAQSSLTFYTHDGTTLNEVGRFSPLGNFGIDETAPASRLHVSFTSNSVDNVVNVQQKGNNTASGIILAANDNNGAGYNFIRSVTTGGTTHWQIWGGVATSTMAFSTGGTERARFNSTGAMVFAGGTTTADGIGITFPATQSASSNANTLDDYEEGTWTPTLVSSGATFTYAAQTGGTYVKIGRLVFLSGVVSLASKSGGTAGFAVGFGNLPFAAGAPDSSGSGQGLVFTAGMGGLTVSADYGTPNGAVCTPNTSTAYPILTAKNGTSGITIAYDKLSSTAYAQFSMTYYANT